MNNHIKTLIEKYWNQDLSKKVFIDELQSFFRRTENDFRSFFSSIIFQQDQENLEYGLAVLYALEENDSYIDFIHQILLEPWHNQYEELAHDLQRRKNPKSIPFIKEAMQNKYPYLESYGTGTRQFINQCGHALKRIGTIEALDVIREFSLSNDPILKDEMLYRISKIEGRNDYKRNH